MRVHTLFYHNREFSPESLEEAKQLLAQFEEKEKRGPEDKEHQFNDKSGSELVAVTDSSNRPAPDDLLANTEPRRAQKRGRESIDNDFSTPDPAEEKEEAMDGIVTIPGSNDSSVGSDNDVIDLTQI